MRIFRVKHVCRLSECALHAYTEEAACQQYNTNAYWMIMMSSTVTHASVRL